MTTRRVLVHDYSGHPFQLQLSRALAKRGHRVLHLYSSDFLTGQGATEVGPDDPDTLEIESVGIGLQFAKYSLFRRTSHEFRYGRVLRNRVREFAPDIVVSSNTPLLAQLVLMAWVSKQRVPFVFWLQDVYSLLMTGALRQRMGWFGDVIGSFFGWLERQMLKRSDGVVSITDDFMPILRRWGVDTRRVAVVPNWAPIEEIPPLARENDWAAEFGLEDKFLFVYSGTIGHKHRPDLLLRIARELPDVTVLVVSEGQGADWLRTEKKKADVLNLVQLPYQPYARLPEVLASADVLIAVLERDAGVYSVPSKVLSYLCSGRPLLASMPPENLAARTIVGNQAGIVVSPHDDYAFVAAAKELYRDSELRTRLGKSARRYAEGTFQIENIADRFEEAFEYAVAVRAARGVRIR